MEIIENVSLVDFYRHQLSRVRERGFSILLLAIARNADAPEVYPELVRNWSDLNDIKGRHVLFALAGFNNSTATSNPIVSEGVYCEQAAVVGKPHQPFDFFWNEGPNVRAVAADELAEQLEQQEAYLENHPTFARYRQRSIAATFSIDQSSQITELRTFLGVSETQTPCLHITLISNDAAVASECFLLPFDGRHGN